MVDLDRVHIFSAETGLALDEVDLPEFADLSSTVTAADNVA